MRCIGTPMPVMRMISAMASNARPFYQALADWLELEFFEGADWQQRQEMLFDGQVEVGFLCGVTHALRPGLELLAAPVMADPCYQGRPVYFSHILVARDSPWTRFEQLRGQSLAYNEPGSYSGYFVLLHHLQLIQAGNDFFAEAWQSGAHQNSLRLLSEGRVQAACVDSVVLEDEGVQIGSVVLEGEEGQGFRSLLQLGPSPAPPALIHAGVPQRERDRLRRRLLEMHEHPEGRAILTQHRRLRFAACEDYSTLAERARAAQGVRLAPVIRL